MNIWFFLADASEMVHFCNKMARNARNHTDRGNWRKHARTYRNRHNALANGQINS